MLDGTTDKEDARLMADIMAAPDPFDGGCAADVVPATTNPETEREYRDRIIDRAHLSGRKLGIYDVIAWLRANGHTSAAWTIGTNADAITAKIESDAARGC